MFQVLGRKLVMMTSPFKKEKILTDDQLKRVISTIENTPASFDSFQNVNQARMVYLTHIPDELYDVWSSVEERLPTEKETRVSMSYALEYPQDSYTYPHYDEADFTTITLLPGSFTGGDLMVGDSYVDLDVGETVIFESRTHHGILPIESGERKVFVVWYAYT